MKALTKSIIVCCLTAISSVTFMSAEASIRRLDNMPHGLELVQVQRDDQSFTSLRRAAFPPLSTLQRSGGPLVNGDFSAGLSGWAVTQSGGSSSPGTVTPISGTARLTEGDSFLVTLEQSFVIPAGGLQLSFDLMLIPGFDLDCGTTDPDCLPIPDAFEAQLLDQNNLPVVDTWDDLATSYFNIQEDGTMFMGDGVTVNGTTVTVDISAVPPGIPLTIFFDLIGADADTGGGVTIDNVAIIGACCAPSGACTVGVSEESCKDQFGTFRPDCLESCATVPAISTWGLVIMGLITMALGTVVIRRRILSGGVAI